MEQKKTNKKIIKVELPKHIQTDYVGLPGYIVDVIASSTGKQKKEISVFWKPFFLRENKKIVPYEIQSTSYLGVSIVPTLISALSEKLELRRSDINITMENFEEEEVSVSLGSW